MEDKLEKYNKEELKVLFVITDILRELFRTTEINVKDKPNVKIVTTKETRVYGHHSWDYYEDTLHIDVPETWYKEVYLNGLGSVRYNNRSTLALSAKELPISKLRDNLQLPGIKLFYVQLPIFGEQKGFNYHWQRTVTIEERYMVAMETGKKTYCYAGLSPNRAAASMKKTMMSDMKKQMGI